MLTAKILKVSQLNLLAKRVLETNFSQIIVEGEISNLVKPSSGHIYFSLKDEAAQVRAVMFRQSNNALKFNPQNGAHVLVTAQVSMYEARGDFQLIVSRIELAGAGILHAKFLQLKHKLEQEGLFDPKYKKPLPRLPLSIGIITSSTGAVIRDILNILKRRFPAVKIVIYPVMVQGIEAAAQIVNALQTANLRQECEILILARGGGSIEDLWPFNEEIVARAIFASVIPVVSAIGHETDFTIADFVAALRAPTPSAAAELIVPNQLEWRQALDNLYRHLVNLMQYQLHRLNLLLKNLHYRIKHPRDYLIERNQRLDDYERRLNFAMQRVLIDGKQRLAKITASLDAISPLATLARGYAIVTINSKVISTITKIKIGDQVQAKIRDGELECLVQGVKS